MLHDQIRDPARVKHDIAVLSLDEPRQAVQFCAYRMG